MHPDSAGISDPLPSRRGTDSTRRTWWRPGAVRRHHTAHCPPVAPTGRDVMPCRGPPPGAVPGHEPAGQCWHRGFVAAFVFAVTDVGTKWSGRPTYRRGACIDIGHVFHGHL